MKRTVRNSFLM